jgi:hypothetical protein
MGHQPSPLTRPPSGQIGYLVIKAANIATQQTHAVSGCLLGIPD